MKRNKSGRKLNLKALNGQGWKWAFLLLLAAQIAFLGLIWLRITIPREDTSQLQSQQTGDLIQVGTFQTTRDQLNATVADYLEDYQSQGLSYKVYATGTQLLFEGTYEILGAKIPLYLYLSPSRDDNGAVVLNVEEISAGSLSLSASDVLAYVAKNYKLPEVIQIDAKQAKILIDLPNLSNDLGLVVKSRTVDLYNDQLIFDLYRKNH